MKVSIIIPVYNESEHLEQFFHKIDSLNLPLDKELVIIDDCSRDGSREISQQFPFKSQVQILLQEVNEGKGAALQRGIMAATGDVIGIQDADFEYDTKDVPKLLTLFMDEKADVVYGSRFKKSNIQVHRTYHYLMNRLLTILSNIFSGLYLTDMETCYKFFKREIIQNIVLESKRFGFEPEVTAKIARLRCRVMEIPISYCPRNYLEGKKITWKDGIAALWHIVNFNLLKNNKQFYRKEMPSQYIPKDAQWL
jgi:glycosyltransferase involved in cell wall biosynthesis